MTTFVPATSAQIALAMSQASAIATALPASVIENNEFVFFAAFDGTDNGTDPPADGSGDSQTTAIAQLYDQLPQSGNLGGIYLPGVGTPDSLPFSDAWDVTITAQSVINAQEAYDAFAAKATAWLVANPDGSLTSMIASFSRGSAAAAIFAEMLYENGLVNTDGKILIPAGTVGAVSAALIIDPVLTGLNGNMEFPPTVQNLTIVQAQNEYRTYFEEANYTGDNATFYQVLGNHGDAGDLYDNGLGGIYLGAYTSFFKAAGLNISSVPSDRAYSDGYPVSIHSEGSTTSILTSNPFYDVTYNDLTIYDPDYFSVARQMEPFGTNGVPATADGSSTSFTGYNGDIILSGTGGVYNLDNSTVVLLPSSQENITGAGDVFEIGSGGTLTYTASAISNQNQEQITLLDNSPLIPNSNDTVAISNIGQFVGFVSGFLAGDTIDLTGIGIVTSAALGNGNVLTISSGSDNPVTTLNLDPTEDYSADSFLVAPDGSGGGDVFVEPNYEPIAFTGTNEVLLVVNPADLIGTISSFVPSDTIDLAGIGTASGATLNANNVLTVQAGTSAPLTVNLSPTKDYSSDNFYVSPDGNGGTSITIGTPRAGYSFAVFAGEDVGGSGFDKLWVSDGTATGTGQLQVSGYLTNPFDFTSLGDETFFAAYDANSDAQLWITDGTAKGTLQLTSVTNSYSGGLNPVNFTVLGSKVLFSGWVDSDTTTYNSTELWVSDGTLSGTKPLTDISNQLNGAIFPYEQGGLDPYDFVVLGNKAVFIGNDTNGVSQIWATDGSASGTLQLTTFSTYGYNVTSPPPVVLGQYAYFEFSGNLLRTDGTAAGTEYIDSGYRLSDPMPVSYSGVSAPIVLGDKIVFSATDSLIVMNGLWVTDGTAAGTTELFPPTSVVNGSVQWYLNPFSITALGDVAVFSGIDESDNSRQLWATDGTAAGTQQLTSVAGGLFTIGQTAGLFFVFGSKALFYGNDADGQQGLWGTDGTSSGTHELAPVISDTLVVFGSKALFTSNDGNGGQLWITDGTVAGTQQLTFVSTDEGGVSPSDITIFGNKALFSGNDANGHFQLWITDGTVAGTQQLTSLGISASDIAVSGDNAFFTGTDSNGDSQLWITDGTVSGTHQVTNSFSGEGGVTPAEITSLPNTLVSCYTLGTSILTECGEIQVERLAIGSRVVTISAVGEIRWIGKRTIECRRHPQPQNVWPVRIDAHAFGIGQPHRDLILSPDHAVFVQGVLIPIKYLINSSTIAQEKWDEVTYYHIELARHDVILAEGLPCESYLDTDARLNLTNGGDVIRLFPAFTSPSPDTMLIWEAIGYAPLITFGPVLDSARAIVDKQAAAIPATSAAA